METALSQRVFPALRSLLRRIRLYVVAAAGARLCLAASVCCLAQFGLDYAFRLRVDLRATVLLAVVTVLAYITWKALIRPLSARADLTDVAALIERRYPHLQSGLIGSVQFAEGRFGGAESNSPVLIRQMLAQATEQADDLPWYAILNHRRAGFHCGLIGVLLTVLLVLVFFAGDVLGVWFERNMLLRDAKYRQNTYLELINDEDGDGVVYWPHGDDLVVRVRVQGRRPAYVAIDLHYDSGKNEEHSMTAVGEDEFRFTIPRLSEPLQLQAGGGDGRTAVARLELVERPKIDEAVITVHPPAYTRESAYQLRSGTPLIEVLAGSEVEILFKANKALKKAALVQDHTEVCVVSPAGEGYSALFRPDRNATYTFELTDLTDLTGTRPRQFLVRVVPDAPPTAVLHIEGASDLITTQAILPLELSLKDRYGLDSAELVCTVGEEGEATRMPIEELQPGSQQLTIFRNLAVADFDVGVNLRWVLSAEALDQNDVTGPGRGLAARHAYRVVSPEELLAELARREQEYRQEFERIIEMQEKLRDDLLTAATVFQRDNAARQRQSNATALERRQIQLGQQSAHVAGQFQRLFDELTVNQLAGEQAEQRLHQGIVAPLSALASRTIPQSAELLARLTEPASELFWAIDRQQEVVLIEMRRILANMSKWEGFHETISLLQTIIKMQKELRDETDAALNQQLDELFKKK